MAAEIRIRRAQQELHDLRVEEWSDLGLAGLAIALSLVASVVASPLAIPLFLGGFVVGVLGMRASVRRWDLCDRLMLDSAAYEISEVKERAERLARPATREVLARSARALLASRLPFTTARVAPVADELKALAAELEDGTLALDPECAVRCRRLLTDPATSPLLNPAVPADGLRIAIRHIRAGFEPSA
jgi:hypothetical protein